LLRAEPQTDQRQPLRRAPHDEEKGSAAVKQEPGCRKFNITLSQKDPNHVFIFEVCDLLRWTRTGRLTISRNTRL
jgi:quinol monooxygenase YgiN